MTYPEKSNTDILVKNLFRNYSGKLTAILVNKFGFQYSGLIEDCIQEAFIVALKKWPISGTPVEPEAWLNRVASNKVLNELKKSRRFVDTDIPEDSFEKEVDFYSDQEIADKQLRLLYAFCTDVLPVRNRVILTLKSLGGLSVKEIASAFQMNSDSVKKVITRGRDLLTENDIRVPLTKEAKKREDAVLLVLYLMFNEGYKASGGNQLIKDHLCREALRLGILISAHNQLNSASADALIALMYFNMARFNARINVEDLIIDLSEQDRSKWDLDYIRMGFEYLKKSRRGESITKYHLEAGISAAHCEASSFEETNWELITKYYQKLLQIDNNEMIYLNYIVAKSYLEGAEQGLMELNEHFAEDSKFMYWLHAVKADIYFRMKDYEKARSYYSVALTEAGTSPEKRFIEKKLLMVNSRCGSVN
jgi:RNA polymerase sigma-70 factor (ECF subfamily)